MKSRICLNTMYLSMFFASSLLLIAAAFSGSAHAAVIAVSTGGPVIYIPVAPRNYYYGYGYHHGYYYDAHGEYHHGNAYHHTTVYRHGNVHHHEGGARR